MRRAIIEGNEGGSQGGIPRGDCLLAEIRKKKLESKSLKMVQDSIPQIYHSLMGLVGLSTAILCIQGFVYQ